MRLFVPDMRFATPHPAAYLPARRCYALTQKQTIMTDSFESTAPNTSAWRPFALLAAYLCMASLGFLGFRAPLIVLVSVVVASAVLGFLAYGRLRVEPLYGREWLVFLTGAILLTSLICIPGVRAALRSHWYLPSQPFFVWLALFLGIRDFKRWRVYGLPFPRYLNDKARNT
jgi:hypothetical protein